MFTVFDVIRTIESHDRVGRKASPSAIAKIHKCSYKKAKGLLDLCVDKGIMRVWSYQHRPSVEARNYMLTRYGREVYRSLEKARLEHIHGMPL